MNGPDVEGVLRGAGLTDEPGKYDSDIHSWRCSHPDIYGPCSCFQELVADLRAEVRAWLESDGAVKIIARGWYLDPDWHKGPESSARAALAALAEQVAQVASVGEGEG